MDIVFARKIILNLLENIFAAWEANFAFTTMFLEVGKRGNIDIGIIMFSQQCFLVCPGLDSIQSISNMNCCINR